MPKTEFGKISGAASSQLADCIETLLRERSADLPSEVRT